MRTFNFLSNWLNLISNCPFVEQLRKNDFRSKAFQLKNLANWLEEKEKKTSFFQSNFKSKWCGKCKQFKNWGASKRWAVKRRMSVDLWRWKKLEPCVWVLLIVPRGLLYQPLQFSWLKEMHLSQQALQWCIEAENCDFVFLELMS